MFGGYSSGSVVFLTLAGPCPFLLPLMSHCPGWVCFFCGSAYISLLSSISIVNSSFYRGQGDLGDFGCFYVFFFFFFFFYYIILLVNMFIIGLIKFIKFR